jgi:putative Tad-like protein involved in Flp pilus assembly
MLPVRVVVQCRRAGETRFLASRALARRFTSSKSGKVDVSALQPAWQCCCASATRRSICADKSTITCNCTYWHEGCSVSSPSDPFFILTRKGRIQQTMLLKMNRLESTRSTTTSCRFRLQRYAKAQIAVVMTLAIVTLIGVMALGTDVAVLYYNWVQLQKAADAAALAGAGYLPNDPDKASSTAINYAEKNGIAAGEIGALNCSGSACNPTFNSPTNPTQILITVHRTVPYYFARVLGLQNATIQAVAAESKNPSNPYSIGSSDNGKTPGGNISTSSSDLCGNTTGGYDILPIVVDDQTKSIFTVGTAYNLSQTGNGSGSAGKKWTDAAGNWGTIQLCGTNSGGSAVRDAIANGFGGPIIATHPDPSTGATVLGTQVQTQTGVDTGNLAKGFADRIGASSDAFAPGMTGVFDPSDPRAVLVPMASFAGCNGTCTLTVDGFLAFYIESYSSGVITGRFINKVPIETSNGVPNWSGDAGVMGMAVLIR